MSISTRTRFEIFKRDDFKCQYCGRTPPAVILHVDHINPASKGGTDDRLNLITACADCNLGKSNKELDNRIKGLEQSLAEERERLEQVKAYNSLLKRRAKKAKQAFNEIERFYIEQLVGENWPARVMPREWVPSIKTFLKYLPPEEIKDSLEIAHERKDFAVYPQYAFRYFCGICWKKIKGGK